MIMEVERQQEEQGQLLLDATDDHDTTTNAALQVRLRKWQLETAGTELDLSSLELTQLPLDVLVSPFASTLRRLNLRNNKLESLPQDFAKLFPQLVFLNVSQNLLTHLPDTFGSLRHLQKLFGSANLLTELPVSFDRLQNLDEIHLAQNKLQLLPSEMGTQLVKLTILDLSNNPLLLEIPETIAKHCGLLRVVDLRGLHENAVIPEKLRRLHEKNVILHSRAKRRELISRALRVRHAVGQNSSILNAAIVNPRQVK